LGYPSLNRSDAVFVDGVLFITTLGLNALPQAATGMPK
jgi:hypothetical protein